MQHNPNRAAHQYIGHVIDSRDKHYNRDNESEALIHQHGRIISVVTQIAEEKIKKRVLNTKLAAHRLRNRKPYSAHKITTQAGYSVTLKNIRELKQCSFWNADYNRR